MPIHTDTFLRRADRDDLDTVVAWMEDPEFLHFLYGDPARSPKQIRAHIVGMLGRSAGNSLPNNLYLMIDSREHGPIGLLSLQSISWRNRSCAIDLFIGQERFRAGIVAALSIYRTLEYCFDELNLHRVSAYIYAFNTASWRIFEKTGALRELVMREHVKRGGEYHDLYGYGLLRRDFDALRARVQRIGGAGLQDMIARMAEDAGAASAP